MVNTGRERRFVDQNEKYSRIALSNHTRGLFVNLISLNFSIYGIKECVKIVFTNQDANETPGALWNYHQREQGINKSISVLLFGVNSRGQ